MDWLANCIKHDGAARRSRGPVAVAPLWLVGTSLYSEKNNPVLWAWAAPASNRATDKRWQCIFVPIRKEMRLHGAALGISEILLGYQTTTRPRTIPSQNTDVQSFLHL